MIFVLWGPLCEDQPRACSRQKKICLCFFSPLVGGTEGICVASVWKGAWIFNVKFDVVVTLFLEVSKHIKIIVWQEAFDYVHTAHLGQSPTRGQILTVAFAQSFILVIVPLQPLPSTATRSTHGRTHSRPQKKWEKENITDKPSNIVPLTELCDIRIHRVVLHMPIRRPNRLGDNP